VTNKRISQANNSLVDIDFTYH